MAHYEIQNANTAYVLGVYEGETEEEALDAMARDAGYQDYASIAEQQGQADEDDLVITEVDAPDAA